MARMALFVGVCVDVWYRDTLYIYRGSRLSFSSSTEMESLTAW